jgi:hypothetical protein
MSKRAHLITGAVVVTVFVLCLGAIGGWWGEAEPEPPSEIEAVQDACYEAVLGELKSPSSAELVSIAAAPEGDGWTVWGAVDAENSFGAVLTEEFECALSPSGDRWTLDSVAVG